MKTKTELDLAMSQTDSVGTPRWILPGSVELQSIQAKDSMQMSQLLCIVMAIDE